LKMPVNGVRGSAEAANLPEAWFKLPDKIVQFKCGYQMP